MTEKQNRHLLPGLAVVATPIGNLGDLSPRAVSTLKEADFVCVEDTRVTRRLLSALGITTPRLVLLDAHRERSRELEAVIKSLSDGLRGALVTDAGSPGVSDPGARLVRACHRAEIPVVAVPGPSALSAAISISGLEADEVIFRGFYSRKKGEEVARLRTLAQSPGVHAVVWFESPNRVGDSVSDLAEHFPKTEMWVGKELTKIYERAWMGTAEHLARELKKLESAEMRGEWVMVCRLEGQAAETPQDFDKTLACLRDAGVRSSEAVAIIVKQFNAHRRSVYASALRIYKNAERG